MSNDAMTTLQEQIAKLNQITQNGFQGFKGKEIPQDPGAKYTGILENPAVSLQQGTLPFQPVVEADDPLAGYQLPQKEGGASTAPTDYSGVTGKLRWGKNFVTSVGQGVADTGTHQLARGGNGIVEWFLDEVGNIPQWVGKEGYNNIDNVRTLLRKEEGYDKLKAAKQKDLLRGGDPSGVTQAASLWGIKMGAEENEATRGDWNKYFGLRWNRYVNAIRRGEAAVPKDEKAATILAGMKEFEEAHPHKFDVLKPETLVAEAKDQYLVPPDSPEFKQRFDSSNDMADRWGEDATKHAKIMNELSAKRLAGKTRSDPEYWGYKVGQNSLNYALAIGATALTKNPTIGAAIVAVPVAGDAYASAREAGYSPEYSASYAALYGAAEYFPEKLVLGKLVAGAGSGILKQTASNAVMEGTQEGITEIAQMALDQGYKVNDDPNLTFQKAIGRVFDAMVLGGIMGGMGGASHATLNKALAATPMDRAAARDSYLQEFNNIRQALEQGLPQDQLDEIIRNPAPASPASTNPASPASTNQANPASTNQANPAPANPTDLFSQVEIDFLNDPKNPLNSATDAQTIQGAQEILANPDSALDPYRQNAETLLQGMRTKYDPSSLAPQVQQWEQHRSAGTSMWSTPPSSQAARYSQAENDALINHFNKTIGRGTQAIDTSGILPDGSVLQGEGITLPDGRVIMNFDNISPQISTVTGQQILSREDRAAIVGNHELSHRAERGFVDSLPDGGQLYNEIRQRLATNQVIGNLARAIQAERVAQVSAGQQAANTLIDDYTAVSEAYAELMGALTRPRGYEALVDRYLDYLPRKIKKPALRRLIDKTAAGLRNIFAKWTGKSFTPQTLSNQEVADIFASINSHRYYGLKNPAQQVSSPATQATGPSPNPISRTGMRQAPVFSTRPAEEYAAQLVNRVLGDINGFNTWLDNFVLVKTWSDNDIHILATSLKFNEQLPDDRLARLFDKFTHTWDFYKPWRQHDYNFANAANDLAILARALPDEQVAMLSIPDNLKEYFGYYRGIQAARYTKLKNFYDNLESTSYPATLPAMRNIILQNILLGTYGWGETQVKTPEDIMAEVKALKAVRFPKEVEQSIYVAAQIISTSGATNELVNATVNKLVAKHPTYADRITQFMQSLGSISSSVLILGAEDYISLIEKLAAQKLRARKPVTYEWRGHEFTSPPEKGKPALVASHEMTLWKLKEVLHNEGKLAAPSIALARADTFNGIGWGQMEIAFLADLASIPENNYIFGMDAYTPVFSPYTSGTIEDINNSLVDDVQLKFSSGGREEYYIEELLSEESPEYPNSSIFERTALSPLLTAKQTDEAREVIGTKSLDDLQKLLYKYETQVRAETKIMAEKFGLEWGRALASVGTETLRIMGSDKLEGLYTLQKENPKAYQYMRENISPIIEEAKQEILGRGKYMELKVLDTVPLNKFSAALLHKGLGTENYSEQLAELVADGVALIWAANPKHIHNATNTGLKQATNTFPNLLFSTEPVQTTVNLEEYTAPKVGKAALHNLLLNRLATAQVEAKPLSLEQLSSYVAQLDLTPFPKAVRQSLYNAASIVTQQPSQLGSMVSQLAETHPAYATQIQSFMEAAVEAASGLAALPPSSRESVLESARLPISSPKKTTYTFQGQEFTSPPEKGKTPLTITQSMGYHKFVNLMNSGGKLYAPSVAIINPENFDGVALGGMDVTFIGNIASLPENTLLFGADAYTPSFEESMAGGTPEEIASQIAARVTASHGSLETRLKEALAAAQGSTVFGNSIVDALIAPNMTAEQVEENRGKVGTLGENTAEVFYVVDSFLNEYSEAITNTASSIFNEVVKSDIAEMKQAISKEFAHQVLGVPYESMPGVKLVEKVDGLREWLAKDIEPYATGLRENTLFRLPYLEGKVLEAMPLSNFKAAVVHTAPSTQEQYRALDKLEKSGVPVVYAIDNLKEGVKQAASIMPDLLFSTNQFFNVEEDTSHIKPALEDVAGTITLAELQAYPPRDTTSINWEGSPVLQDLDALAAAPPSEVLKGPVLYAMQNDLFSWGQKRDLLKNWAATGALPPGYLQYTPVHEVERTLNYGIPAEGQAALSLAHNMRWEKLKEKWIQEARQVGLKRPVQLGSGEIPQRFDVSHMLHSLMVALHVIGDPQPGPSPYSEAELLKKLHVFTETADHVGMLYQAAMIEALGGNGAELLNKYAQSQSPHVAHMLREDWDTLYELRRLAYLRSGTFIEAVEASGLLNGPTYPRTVNISGYEFTSPPEKGKTPFIIVHGMDLDKLQWTLETGGLAAPSLGIVKSGFDGLEWLEPTIGFIMSPEKLSRLNYIMYRGDSFTPTWNAARAHGGPDTTVHEKSDIIRDLVENNLGTMEKWISRLAKNGELATELDNLFTADIINGQELDQSRKAFEKKVTPAWDAAARVVTDLINGLTATANDTGAYEDTDLEWVVRSLGLELGWDISPPAAPVTFEVNNQVMAAVKKAAAAIKKVRNQQKYREVKVTDFVKLEDFTAVQVARGVLNSSKGARLVRELVSMGLVVIPADTNSLDSNKGAKATQQLIGVLPQLTFSIQPPNPNSLQSPELQQKIKEAVEEWTTTGTIPPGYLQHTPFNEIQQTLDSLPQETMMALVTSYNMRWEKLKEKWIQEARQAGLKRPVQLDYTAGKNHSPAGLIHSLLTTLPVMGEPLHTPSTQTVAELISKLNILQESMAGHANVFYQAAMVESLGGRGAELLDEYILNQNDTVAKQLHEDWDTLHELRSLAFANTDTFVNEVNKAIHVTHTPTTVEVAGYEFTSPPQEGKTPFILAHAMSASKLQLVLQSGGLVAPSIAITKSSFRGLDWVNPTIGFIMDPAKLRGMEYVLYRGDSYTPTWHSAQYINPEGTTEELNKIAKDLTFDSMGTMEKWISHAVEQGNIIEQAPLLFRADIISGQQLEQGRESFEKPKVDYTFAVNSQLKEIAFDIADITGGNVREILKDPTYVEWMVRALGHELGWDILLPKPSFEITPKLDETIKKAATWLEKVMNGSKYRELKITDFVRLEDFSAVQVTKEELESPSVARIMQELVAHGLVVIPVDAVNSNPEDEAFYGLSKSASEYATQNLLKAFPNLSFSIQPPNPNSLQSPELQSKISEAINQNLLPPWEKIMEQWVATNKLYGGEESWAVASNMGETELEYEDWVTVRTPAFKKWFGDWEDGKRHSIVVNPRTGEPLKVYHGSLAHFDTFSFKHLGSTGSAHGHGFYFTDDPQLATGYATKGDEVGHIYSGFLNIRRLLGENTKKLRRRDVYNLLHKMVRNGSEILWDFNDLNKYQLETVLSQAVDQLFELNTNDADILAELGNLDNVEDVHRAFGGSPGYQYTLPDGRHYYIALLPNQFKAVNNYGSFSPRQDNMMFSTQPRSSEAALATAYSVPPWELREDLPGIGSRAKRLWQVITSDRVKDLWADKQGELERIVKKLPGNDLALAMRNGWKAYNAQVQADLMNDIRPMQEALSAELAEQLNRVRATIPMYKGMRKSKAMKLFMEHLDKIGKYVYHGEERNMEIALRTGGADLAGSGRTLPEIAEVKQFFMDPARGGGELLTIYENIYNTHIKPMLKYSEDRLRAAGLLTPEMEAARPNYKWYIPLYGKPEIEDPAVSHNIDDSFRSRTGGGALARDTLANRTHNAEGRHGTEAHNLFENIFTQLESTVRRVRAQEPKQRLWEFLQTSEGAAAFDATTSQHQLGNQATVNAAGQQTWLNQATADNQVIWQNGNDVHVMTIGNELALNAVKNFNRSLFPYEGNPLAQPGAAAWHGVAWVTRFMGSMYTRYNPSFILRNKMMDSLQQWQYILADAPVGGMTTAAGPRGYLEAVGNVAGRLKLALLAASYNTMWTGTLGKTRGFEQWYKRYEALGGVTTYASFLGRNTLINLASDAWRQAANPIEKALDVRGNLNWLAELLNKANDTMELTTRVSAFRALVESGVEEETAAHYVKDIMNFETKGDIARGINAFYPFFTTSLFDMRRILKTLSHKEGQVLLAALVGISYTMWAALAAATGDDDDGQAWVDKYPMGIASRYAIVPVVSDDGVMRGEGIRIPLGFGLGRIANTIALSWRRYFNGTDEPSDLVSNLVNHAMIGSLSPIQPSDVNIKEDPVTWLGNTFLPQVLKPVLQYSSNKNWRGQPIYNPGTFRSEGELDYNTGFAATPDLYKSLAEKLYDGTGYDVAPESIAYWVETAFGGLGRDVVSSTEFFMDKTGAGEPPTTSWWRNIPMLSGLTQSSPSITREKYFEYRMAVEDEYNRLMDANKRGKSPDAYMRSYGYKKQFDAVEAQLRELRKYRKQVREGLHGAERQAAERQLNDAMQVLQANMVKLYEEQTGRKK